MHIDRVTKYDDSDADWHCMTKLQWDLDLLLGNQGVYSSSSIRTVGEIGVKRNF